MTEPTRTRRGFLGLLTGTGAPEPAAGFSLSRFYAKRQAAGEATGEALPEFELTKTAEIETTAVGTPELRPAKR